MRGEEGFTLIEALVALAVGVSVISVVLSTLHVASSGATKAVSVAAEAEAFARASAVLAGDAGHALKLDGLFQGSPQALRFALLSRQGGAALVSYQVAPNPPSGVALMRSEGVLLAGGAGPMGAAQPIWQAGGLWEFRYLDAKGDWRRDWTGADLPRAFGLVSVGAPEAVELVATFPDLIEPACALGPGSDCGLDPGVFP